MAASQSAETFETGDDGFQIGPVVEVASATKPAGDDENATLEETKTNLTKAHKGFKGKTLDANGTGGFTQRPEYGIAGAGESETLEERCNRLRAEVQELMGDLKAAEASPDPSVEDEAVATVEMAKQMQAVSEQLSAVKLDAITGDWNGPVPAALQADLNAQLLKDLAAAKTVGGGAAGGAKAAGGAAGGGVTYELYYNAEQAKFADATDAGALDLRIAKLEKVIGGGDLSRAAAELGDVDLNISSAITNIAERAAILEAESTAAMTARLSALLTLKGQAEAVKKTDGKPATEEHVERVNTLYSKMQEWDATSQAVPELITRLTALKGLHERGTDFGKTLSHLEETQKTLTKALSDDKTVLEKLEGSFAANMATIEGNFAALDARVEAINANLAKLKK